MRFTVGDAPAAFRTLSSLPWVRDPGHGWGRVAPPVRCSPWPALAGARSGCSAPLRGTSPVLPPLPSPPATRRGGLSVLGPRSRPGGAHHGARHPRPLCVHPRLEPLWRVRWVRVVGCSRPLGEPSRTRRDERDGRDGKQTMPAPRPRATHRRGAVTWGTRGRGPLSPPSRRPARGGCERREDGAPSTAAERSSRSERQRAQATASTER